MAFATISCKSKKEIVKKEVKTEIVGTETEEIVEVNEDMGDAKPTKEDMVVEEENYIVAIIERTICFGACPTYKAIIYKDGTVIYKGTANVNRIGNFKGKLPLEAIESFLGEAREIGFLELKNTYDNKNVSDVPSTVTYINFGKENKKVLCRFECDERIEKINKMLENFINEVEYKRVEE